MLSTHTQNTQHNTRSPLKKFRFAFAFDLPHRNRLAVLFVRCVASSGPVSACAGCVCACTRWETLRSTPWAVLRHELIPTSQTNHPHTVKRSLELTVIAWPRYVMSCQIMATLQPACSSLHAPSVPPVDINRRDPPSFITRRRRVATNNTCVFRSLTPLSGEVVQRNADVRRGIH